MFSRRVAHTRQHNAKLPRVHGADVSFFMWFQRHTAGPCPPGVLVLRPWSPVVPVDLHSLAAYRCFFFSGGAHLLLRGQAGIRTSLDGYVMNLVEYLVPEEMLSSDLDDVASLLHHSLVKLTSLGW